MSYYTNIEVWRSGDDAVSVDMLMAAATEHVEGRGCYAEEDVLADLRKALTDPTVAFNDVLFSDLLCSDFELLFRDVSRQFPRITFLVRGRGEEADDIWLREFRAGEITKRLGPFGEAAAAE